MHIDLKAKILPQASKVKRFLFSYLIWKSRCVLMQ